MAKHSYTLIVIAAAMLAVTPFTHARLGWTETQMDKKFEYIGKKRKDGGQELRYKHRTKRGIEFRIGAMFMHGKVARITYTKVGKVSLTDDEIAVFLRINQGDEPEGWGEYGGVEMRFWKAYLRSATWGSYSPFMILFTTDEASDAKEKWVAQNRKKMEDDF